MSIEVSTATSSLGDGRLVFVDVVLKNTGQRRLDASLASSPQLAGEFDRSVRFAGSLQIRQIAGVLDGALAHVDWWDEKSGLLGALTVPEVNLLMEFTDAQGQPEFFMEPGEEYHLGNSFVLASGTYLAKVVFVGARFREYWSRIVQISVN